MSGLVHLLEAGLPQAAAIAAQLGEEGYRVQAARDIQAMFAEIQRNARAIAVLASPAALGAAEAGAEAMRRIRRSPGCPVVGLLPTDDLAHRLQAVRMGIEHALPATDIGRLGGLLAELSGLARRAPPRVLLIDDDRILNEYHAALLRNAGMGVRTLYEPLAALETLNSYDPDVIFLNIRMAGCSGIELAAAIRLDPRHARVPIVFVSSENDPGTRLACIRAGGEDYLRKPVEAERLVAVAEARARLSRQLRPQAGGAGSRIGRARP